MAKPPTTKAQTKAPTTVKKPLAQQAKEHAEENQKAQKAQKAQATDLTPKPKTKPKAAPTDLAEAISVANKKTLKPKADEVRKTPTDVKVTITVSSEVATPQPPAKPKAVSKPKVARQAKVAGAKLEVGDIVTLEPASTNTNNVIFNDDLLKAQEIMQDPFYTKAEAKKASAQFYILLGIIAVVAGTALWFLFKPA